MKYTKKHTESTRIIPYRPRRRASYPNAASPRDIYNRILDYCLTAVASAGIVTALMCMFAFL